MPGIFSKKFNTGFTLIELLIVIGIVAILAGLVIIAVNPMRQIAKVNDVRRQANLRAISDAITQNIVDNQGFFSCAAGDIPAAPATMDSTGEIGHYDICGCLFDTYLAGMPVDPQYGYYNDCSDYNSEYTIQSGSIILAAPYTQLGEPISITVPGEITVKTPPTFNLSNDPSSGSVIAGNSTSTNVTATSIEGFSQTVNFSTSIDPSEPTISLTFSPADNCTPTCNLTLNVSTTPATPPGTYSIIIRGIDGGFTKQTTFTLTVVSSPPTAPSNLAGNAFCAGSNNPDISLSWQDNSDNEEGFKLYRGNSVDFIPTDPPLALVTGVTSYTDTTLLPATTYYYKIKAFNAAGDSAFVSSEAIATDSCAPTFVLIPSSALIYVGQTQQFDGEYDPDGPGGSASSFIVDRSVVSWSSSDILIATINSTGLASGQTPGSVTISGVYSGSTATANLSVLPWWDSEWQYRRPVTISWLGSALSDYQVRLIVNTAELIAGNKLQADCDDLRFVDSDDLTQLNYWLNDLESGLGCNQLNTEVWVKVSSIPTGGKTIYMYYQNNTASVASNFNNTFPNRLETSQTLTGVLNYDAVKLIGPSIITISSGLSLTINARYIYVEAGSQINGNQTGRTGGSGVGCANGIPGTGNNGIPGTDGGRAATRNCNQATTCAGCQSSLCTFLDDGEDGSGGGGGGSGGAGGQGGQSWTSGDCDSRPACGGGPYGSLIGETFYLGAGGGSGTGSCYSINNGTGGAGGRGGGAVKLEATKITYPGRIYLNAGNGANGNCSSISYGCGGGGGGAGGQLILKGQILNLNIGTFEAKGGNGGARSQIYGGAGGGGGGGRIKLFYENLSETGTTYNVAAGASGGTSYKAPQAVAGSAGTIYKGSITFTAPTSSIGIEEGI